MSLTLHQIDEPLAIPAVLWDTLAAGWISGPPEDLPEDALQVDKYTAAVLPCERCHATGGRYLAVHRQPDGYRAWSSCPDCGQLTEM